jgi:hypothetical protein
MVRPKHVEVLAVTAQTAGQVERLGSQLRKIFSEAQIVCHIPFRGRGLSSILRIEALKMLTNAQIDRIVRQSWRADGAV